MLLYNRDARTFKVGIFRYRIPYWRMKILKLDLHPSGLDRSLDFTVRIMTVYVYLFAFAFNVLMIQNEVERQVRFPPKFFLYCLKTFLLVLKLQFFLCLY
jgi:hypothetical protein